MNVTFKFIIYFDIILSECGETKTKHSSCLFDENDKHRSAMSIKGMVTCNNINGSLQAISVSPKSTKQRFRKGVNLEESALNHKLKGS